MAAEVLALSAEQTRNLAASTFRRLPVTARTLYTVEDLISIGQVAALRAAQDFDPSQGAMLKTWIQIRVAFRMRELHRTAIAQDQWQGGRHLTETSQFEADEDGSGRHDTRLVDPNPSPEDLVAREDARHWVARAAATRLTHREGILVAKRLQGQDETDRELGASFGVARSQASRGIQSAIKKLSRVAYAAPLRGVVTCG